MKVNNIFIFCIFLLAIFTLGAASAADGNITQDLTVSDVDDSANEIVESPVNDVEIEEVAEPQENDDEVLSAEKITDDTPLQTDDERNDSGFEAEVPSEILINDDENIKFNLPDEATGYISIYVDDSYITDWYPDWGDEYYPLYTNGLNVGPHILKLNFIGDELFKPVNKTYTFNVINSKISIPENPKVQSDFIIVSLPEDATGTITVKSDGKQMLIYDVVENSWTDNGLRVCNLYFDEFPIKSQTVEVIYSGDSKYSKLTKKQTVNVDYDIIISASGNFVYGENEDEWGSSVSVSIPYDATAKPTIKLDGKNYIWTADEDSPYYMQIRIDNLSIGNHTIEVSYQDKKYPLKTETATFKISPLFKIDDSIQYGEISNITVIVSEESSGCLNVSYKVSGEDEYIPYGIADVVNGKAVVEIKNLDAGNYVFYVNYTGDYEDDIESGEYDVTVTPKITAPSSYQSGTDQAIVIRANEDFNSSVSAYYVAVSDSEDEVDWEYVTGTLIGQVDLVKGEGSIPLTLGNGYYGIKVEFEIDGVKKEKYFFVSVRDVSPKFNLTANVPETFLKSSSYDYYDDYNVIVYLPDDFNGKIELYVDGKQYGGAYYEENAEFIDFAGSSFNLGKHTLTIKYSDDSYYEDASVSYDFEVLNVNIIIPKEIVIGDEDYIRVELPDDAKGTVTVYVDGKQFDKITKNDYDDYDRDYGLKVDVDMSKLSVGKHTIRVTYTGDSKYGNANKEVTLNTTYLLSINAEGTYVYGYDFNAEGNTPISVKLPYNIKNKPTIKIDGAAYNVGDVEEMNYIELDISKLAIGTHTIEVSYQEGTKYPFKSVNATFIIKPVIQASSYVEYGDGSEASLKLPADAKGNLTVYVSYDGGYTYELLRTAPLVNGYVAVKMDDIKVGSSDVRIVYTGSDYEVEQADLDMEVKINIQMPTVMTYGQNKYMTIKSDASDNRELTVMVNGKVYGTVKLVNGNGKLSLNKLPINDDLYLEIYDGEDYAGEKYIQVNPIKPKFTGAKNIKMFYLDGTKYSLKVYGVYGKVVGKGQTVTFKIGKETYKVKTNAKGIATLKIKTVPGNYKIVASYNGAKVTKNLVVKQVLKLNKATVKKSAKKLVLKATLKGKKALKSKKVTFKFNGKKYTAKTNKKGVAKVTIKSKVLKKLKPGKKLTYTATYVKDTVKQTVKVKK